MYFIALQNKQKSDIVVGSWFYSFDWDQIKCIVFTLWLNHNKKKVSHHYPFFISFLKFGFYGYASKNRNSLAYSISRKPETKVKEGEWSKVLFFSKRNAFLVVFNSIDFFLSVWLPVQLWRWLVRWQTKPVSL